MLDKFRDYLSHATPAQRCILVICTEIPFLIAFILGPSVGLMVPELNPLLVPRVIMMGNLVMGAVMGIQIWMLVWLWPRRFWPTPLPRMYAAITMLATIGIATTAIEGGNLTYPSNMVVIGLVPCGLLMLDIRSTALGFGLGMFLIGLSDLAIFTGMMPYAPGYGAGAFVNGKHHIMAEVLRSGIQYISLMVYSVLIFVLFGQYEQHRKKLTVLSQIDMLTGLANRRHFMERLEFECGRLERSDHPLSLIMIDADHFKKINDTHGHMVGDYVLGALADNMRAHMRVSADVAARVGGEEFAIILPDTDLEGARAVCHRIQAGLARVSFQGARATFKVTLSMGVVESSGHGAETLLHYADANLYLAKAQGRNQIVATRLESEKLNVRAHSVA